MLQKIVNILSAEGRQRQKLRKKSPEAEGYILFSCKTKENNKIIHCNDISFSFIRLNYTFLLETICISYPKLDVSLLRINFRSRLS